MRNCSDSDMHPAYLPTPADIVALGHVLRNRTVAFIGDSTTQAQYEYLCLKLRGRNSRRKWKFPKDYFMKPSHCPLPHLGARTLLTFEGAGQRFDWARLPSAAATLNASLHGLRAVDVVVFNAGIHWHAGCKRGTDSGAKYAELVAGFHDVLAGAQYCKAKHTPSPRVGASAGASAGATQLSGAGPAEVLGEGRSDTKATRPNVPQSRASASRAPPLLIWRETLPQHFPTSNGGYPLGQKFVGDVVGLTPGEKLTCAPLTPERAVGAGLQQYQTCNPNCLPSTWQNDLANPVMLEQCVDILYTYEDFRCLHLYHTNEDNWDCTHYHLELVHYLNWKLLKLISRTTSRRRRGRRRSSHLGL